MAATPRNKVVIKKKVEAQTDEVRSYARKIWLAGLGAYAKVGKEGVSYIQELIKTGEQTERQGKQLTDKEVVAANAQIDSAKTELTVVKGKVETQLDKIETAFDGRVASALNRIGIPSRHDLQTLSAKLDQLTALVERVARKQ
ncbi:phasin family protein [Pseudomonas sp. UBA4194]|uniref:phasin family protein n=1 Tax=Pseudomonas sp. UBA4194 TaxID=1947317 RepID=UPI0025CF9F45|nr:phasin family protein [Pseudomonas sp. UBA4194]